MRSRVGVGLGWMGLALVWAVCQAGCGGGSTAGGAKDSGGIDLGVDALADAGVSPTDAGADTSDARVDTADASVDVSDASADTADTSADAVDANADAVDVNTDVADGNPDVADVRADVADAAEDTTDAAADAPDAPDAGGGDVADAADGGGDAGRIVFRFPANRDLDLLLLVDDSPGMTPLQAKFRSRLSDFMNVLASLPGGPPNLHVAVVSSSLGAGAYGNVPGCQPGTVGNLNGSFQHKASCTALPATEHFVKSVGGVNNFTGNIADVLSCITNLGELGCGLEHQFEATRLALQRAQNPADPDNAGFLRPNAHLAIVMVTNEDDCSVASDSTLFDPNQLTLSDPLGGLQSYRCSEFGHKCGPAPGTKPPHRVTADVTLQNCVSAEDGVLVTVDSFAKFVRALKAGANQIVVAALAGPAAPYVVSSRSFMLATGASEVQPIVGHSCTQAVAAGAQIEVGDPGVRINQWLNAFGSNGVVQSICAPDFAPALTQIAEAINWAMSVNCVSGQILLTADGAPDCRVVETVRGATGATTDAVLPSCTGGRPIVPCWEFLSSAQCSGGQRFQVCRDALCSSAGTPTDGRTVDVSCTFAP